MKLITAEDIDLIYNSTTFSSDAIAKALNKLLEENGQMGYTYIVNDLAQDVCAGISTEHNDEVDTHRALVFLEPIEEEKPACDHIYRGCVGFADFSIYPEMVPSKSKYEFCPMCGEPIKHLRDPNKENPSFPRGQE